MKFKAVYRTILMLVIALSVFAGLAIAQQNRYSRRQVGDLIAKLERSSNTFRRDFDREMDRSSINGTNEEDRLNRIVANFESAMNRLRRDFDGSDNWWESRNNVNKVMDEARQVNAMMNNLSFARRLENQWRSMRSDINRLADTFDLPGLGSGPIFGGGGGNVPQWMLGTWYGRNPMNGSIIQLTINSNGSATADFGGSMIYGTADGTRVHFGGATSRVSRLGNNGMRTTRTDNGERIDYYRNRPGGGGLGGGGNIGNVPNWATGTFWARNPQTGGRITLTIQSNGNVTVNMDGNISYGSVYGTTFTLNGESSTISKISNGIRTRHNRTGERIDYRRQ